MSRMVRENAVSGLRERVYFAQSLYRQLIGEQQEAPPTLRLALRSSVLFHLYSALVGLVRQSAKTYQVPATEQCFSLATLEQAFKEADVHAPEINVLAQARADHNDVIAWLEGEVDAAMGASGLARRPLPPGEGNALNLLQEDTYAPLAEGDIGRLASAIERVNALLEHCVGYLEEW